MTGTRTRTVSPELLEDDGEFEDEEEISESEDESETEEGEFEYEEEEEEFEEMIPAPPPPPQPVRRAPAKAARRRRKAPKKSTFTALLMKGTTYTYLNLKFRKGIAREDVPRKYLPYFRANGRFQVSGV